MGLRIVLSAMLTIGLAGNALAARIYVTTPTPGIGTGACSLQEAIYASVLHDTLDGVHGIAIDATDQGNPPDHFITTGCEMGDGNDTIVLPTRGHLKMDRYLDGDAYNPLGPTATPAIFSTITIEGNGATLEWTGIDDVRLFAVIPDTVKANGGDVVRTPNGVASGVGNLTLRNVDIKGFRAHGGDSSCLGGGGMGAGGAIYVWGGYLTVENSTFEGNRVAGGDAVGVCGTSSTSGGGGGIWGNGGVGTANDDGFGAGGGGGGSKGDGGLGTNGGGGGGGTVFSGGDANGDTGGASGFFCGGNGGDAGSIGADGHAGRCPGGGGGGGGNTASEFSCGANGGAGNYGGGGGGAGGSTGFLLCHPDGGRGGFGGGGGGTQFGNGGNGGFGGGGGWGGVYGKGGFFARDPSGALGGNGAALGGAVFSDGGVVTIRNSTFANNRLDTDDGAGAAIFAHDGSLTVMNSTISGNCAGGDCRGPGGGIVVFGEHSAAFTLVNTIVAHNPSTAVPRDAECYVQGTVSASGTGNLILDNGPPTRNAARPDTAEGGSMSGCPGVASNAFLALGPLQDNGGYTKTMAISFGSAAMGAADGPTSLPSDQRGAARPQAGGFDIGAYEVCRIKVGAIFQPAPCAETAAQDPPVTFTMQASVGGVTDPPAGSYPQPPNTVVPVQAIASDGFYFKGWTGNVVSPLSASTTVIMNDAKSVGAVFQQHDFVISLSPATLSMAPGDTSTTVISASALGDYADTMTLTASTPPAGVGVSLGTNPLTPVPATPAASIVTLTIGPSAVAQSFTETITGTSTGPSGTLTHSTSVKVAVVLTPAALINVINQDLALGCIDQSGIAQALIAKINAYQLLVTGGHAQGASNVLAALEYEVQAQIGRHIATSCNDPVGGNAFSPGQALIADVQALLSALGSAVKAAPIVGSITSTSDAGAGGRTINVTSGKTVIASAMTDAAGFYYVDTSTLKHGMQYGATVAIPKGYKTSTPASQTFTWPGSTVKLADFVLN